MKSYRTGNKSSHGARCYATGGRVPEDISDPGSLPKVTGGPGKADGGMIDGGKAKKRLDRPSKSPVSVNVIVAGKDKPEPSAITPPLGAVPPAPPMPPPAAPPIGGPPPMPMRASGGRVNKKAGGGRIKSLDALGGVARSLKRMTQGKEWRNQAQNSSLSIQNTKDRSDQDNYYNSPASRAAAKEPEAEAARNRRVETEVNWKRKRAAGGRVSMDAGAGGGEGRLEKVKAYGGKAKGK